MSTQPYAGSAATPPPEDEDYLIAHYQRIKKLDSKFLIHLLVALSVSVLFLFGEWIRKLFISDLKKFKINKYYLILIDMHFPNNYNQSHLNRILRINCLFELSFNNYFH